MEDTREFCVICLEEATDECRAIGHNIHAQKKVPVGINQTWRWDTVRDFDALKDIYERNSHLTKFLRDNAPREDMPEVYIKKAFEAGVINLEECSRAITELNTIRNTTALYAEVAEYSDETAFKWWGRGAWETQKGKAGEELIDILHFLLIAFEDLGFTAEDIHQMYCDKNRSNWQRFKDKLGWKKPQR